MKKLILLFILFFNFFNFTFSYDFNQKEIKILNNFYHKLDKFDFKKLEKIKFKINILLKNKFENIKLKYFLIEIKKYISKKNYKINRYFKVLKVIDWDTIIIDYFWKKENIRFIWIDAPEDSKIRKGFVECYWKESKNFLYKLLNNKNIRLEFDETQWKRDKYNRLLAYVFLDWLNVNNFLIKEGFAKEYTYNKPYKYQRIFQKAQKTAQNKKLWIWSKKCNKKIFNNQKNNVKNLFKKKCIIKWNISYKTKKKLYHLPNCFSYKKTKINLDKWEKWFCTEEEAIKAWWKKALNCP